MIIASLILGALLGWFLLSGWVGAFIGAVVGFLFLTLVLFSLFLLRGMLDHLSDTSSRYSIEPSAKRNSRFMLGWIIITLVAVIWAAVAGKL